MSEALTPPIRAGPIPTGWPTSPREGEKPHWPLTLDPLQFESCGGTYHKSDLLPKAWIWYLNQGEGSQLAEPATIRLGQVPAGFFSLWGWFGFDCSEDAQATAARRGFDSHRLHHFLRTSACPKLLPASHDRDLSMSIKGLTFRSLLAVRSHTNKNKVRRDDGGHLSLGCIG